MIFIDFDDVIFNTQQFKHDFKDMFVEYGVPEEIFDKYYNDPNDQSATKTFDPWRQISNIGEELKIDTEKLVFLMEEFLADISRYVFEDVPEFAEKFGKQNIYIVSFGEMSYQTTKIENSKIVEIIGNIVVTQDTKSNAIADILNKVKPEEKEKIYFLDDRIEQIKDVKGNFPQIVTILLKRPEGRYQEMQMENCCDYQACNLREAEQIIEKHEKEN